MRQSVCIKSWVFCGLVLLGTCVSVFGEDKIEAMKQCAAKSAWVRGFFIGDYDADQLTAAFDECWKGESDTIENVYSECRRVCEDHEFMNINISGACSEVREVIRENCGGLVVYFENQVAAAFEACLAGESDPLWDIYVKYMKASRACRDQRWNELPVECAYPMDLIRVLRDSSTELSFDDDDRVAAAFKACLAGETNAVIDVHQEWYHEMKRHRDHKKGLLAKVKVHDSVKVYDSDWLSLSLDLILLVLLKIDSGSVFVLDFVHSLENENLDLQKIAIVAMRLTAFLAVIGHYDSMYYGHLERGLDFADIL